MHSSELPNAPDLTIPAIPVICDQCAAAGLAGDAFFSAIPDILAFAPVPRRAHANGWSPEHQRAFIAAVAITGSPRQAARAIGRHQFGAEGLRTAKGGKAFAEAWDAAMDLAREREAHRIHVNIADLAAEREAQLDSLSVHPAPVEGGQLHPDCDYDPDAHADDYPEFWQAKRDVRERMIRARGLLLMLFASDPAKRDAWETLCGPVNWEQAAAMEAEDGEAYARPDTGQQVMHSARDADVLIAAEAGFLPDLTGGRDGVTEIIEEVLRLKSAAAKSTDGAADAST
jgi:hypothetical protein